MSPYLHFGQVSPLYLALRVLTGENRRMEVHGAFLEELIVRRELAMKEMKITGFMHNCMRMYRGKKILYGPRRRSMPFEQPWPSTTNILRIFLTIRLIICLVKYVKIV